MIRLKYYMKNVFLFYIPKFLGNIVYLTVILTMLLIATGLVVMSIVEISFSNVDKFILYLLGAGFSIAVMILIMKLLERVQFIWKVLDLDAKIKRNSTKKEILSSRPELSISNVILVSVVVFILILIVLVIGFYLFATIFVEGDMAKTLDYFIK